MVNFADAEITRFVHPAIDRSCRRRTAFVDLQGFRVIDDGRFLDDWGDDALSAGPRH